MSDEFGTEKTKCPHCLVTVRVTWRHQPFPEGKYRIRPFGTEQWGLIFTECPECEETIAYVEKTAYPNADHFGTLNLSRYEGRKRLIRLGQDPDWKPSLQERRLVIPAAPNRPEIQAELLPPELREDYLEACAVLPVSTKASAVLSRRVLQGILREQGYDCKDLYDQIVAVLAEKGQAALPDSLQETIDVIRNFGNFSAHRITHKTTLQVVDVEPGEAEWCLQIVEELFRHYYVEPDRRKKRIEETRAKIKAHGKDLLPKED